MNREAPLKPFLPQDPLSIKAKRHLSKRPPRNGILFCLVIFFATVSLKVGGTEVASHSPRKALETCQRAADVLGGQCLENVPTFCGRQQTNRQSAVC